MDEFIALRNLSKNKGFVVQKPVNGDSVTL